MLHTLTIHLASTVRPQRLSLHNREHLVAPAVLVVEGVLNDGYVPGDELRAEDWNGVPVVVNHPTDASGTPISARSPDVLSAYGVGQLYHASLGTAQRRQQQVTSLRAELWLDVARCTTLGGEAVQALEMLETQTPLEVSTGFFSETASQRGQFAGTPYQEVHRQIRPDHLALLPNAVGACSLADGCGAPRLNHQQCGASCTCGGACERSAMETETPTRFQRLLAMLRLIRQANGDEVLAIQQTDTDIREALYGALAREMGVDVTPIFIDALDMSNQSFTYRQGERLRRRRWEMGEGGVISLNPDIEDVQRDTTYTPVPMAQHPEEDRPMALDPLKARVNALIANAHTGWTETDRPMLETMSEAQLIRLEAQPKQMPTIAATVPSTVQEAIATLPPHLHEPMAAMAQEYEDRKQAAIAVLVANKKCPFTADELQGMSAQRLEQLVAMAETEQPVYAGRGLPHQRPTTHEEQPPPAPSTLDRVLERQKTLGLR